MHVMINVVSLDDLGRASRVFLGLRRRKPSPPMLQLALEAKFGRK
jgi:hypothetical protein